MRLSDWLASERHQRLLERWWVVLTILWEALKTFVIGKTFSKYGADPLIYFIIVTAIAVPYAKLIVKLVTATVLEKWRRVILLSPLVLTLHFIPDLYIIYATDELPTYLLDTFLFIIFLFLVLGIRAFVVNVRRGRRETLH